MLSNLDGDKNGQVGLSEWLLFVKDNMEKSEHNAKKVRRAPLPRLNSHGTTPCLSHASTPDARGSRAQMLELYSQHLDGLRKKSRRSDMM